MFKPKSLTSLGHYWNDLYLSRWWIDGQSWNPCVMPGCTPLFSSSKCHAFTALHFFHAGKVLVCSGMFKLCPRYLCSYDQDAFNRLGNPTAIMSYFEGAFLASVFSVILSGDISGVNTLSPMYDHVPPDLVTLHIFNV